MPGKYIPADSSLYSYVAILFVRSRGVHVKPKYSCEAVVFVRSHSIRAKM
jgi:hypothetical protein